MSNSKVVADGPLAAAVSQRLSGVELLDWSLTEAGTHPEVAALYTYGHPRVDGQILDRFPALQVISNYGVGVDHIDVAAAVQRGIVVGNTPGILNGATADMAFTLLMATGRRLVEGDRYARSPEFTVYDPGYMLGREIYGQTLGILGMGRIGEQIARRAAGFDMPIVYHNRTRNEEAEQRTGARYVDFEQLLGTADYVVVATPLTPQTTGLIGPRALGLMKSTACLINIARGAVVDTEALTEALASGAIYAAGLDVTDPEPLPPGHPLWGIPNVHVSPHSAGGQQNEHLALIVHFLNNLRAFEQNDAMRNRIY